MWFFLFLTLYTICIARPFLFLTHCTIFTPLLVEWFLFSPIFRVLLHVPWIHNSFKHFFFILKETSIFLPFLYTIRFVILCFTSMYRIFQVYPNKFKNSFYQKFDYLILWNLSPIMNWLRKKNQNISKNITKTSNQIPNSNINHKFITNPYLTIKVRKVRNMIKVRKVNS